MAGSSRRRSISARDPGGRLVVRLAGEREGAPVHAEQAGGAQVQRGLQRLLGRHVHGPGDVARRVGSDRQRGQVERPEPVAGLREVAVVAGVAAEVEALRAEHRPRGPEATALVDGGAPAAVLGGRAHHRQPLDRDRLSPVELHRVGDAAIGEPGLDAERHDEEWIERPGQAAHGGLVEMVVVIVRDQDEVDGRQVVERDAGRRVAVHADESAEGAAALGPGRIGEERHAVELDQHGGVADPGHGRCVRAVAQGGPDRAFRAAAPRRVARRRARWRPPPASAGAPSRTPAGTPDPCSCRRCPPAGRGRRSRRQRG